MHKVTMFQLPVLLQSTVFTVRNGGHSAGFDEDGGLRIF